MEKIKQIFTSRRFWGVIASIVVMALVSLLYFYPDDVQGNVLRQHDMQQGAANGHEVQLYEQQTGETSRWTNALFGGMPTFQISPSYPSNSLFSWINKAMGLGLPYPADMLFMMMAGFFILLIALRMRWYVALIGAIGYGLSSYFIIIIGAGHLWKFITLAYIPPTIAGIVLCYRGRYLLGASLAALFAMLQISSNHVQMTYYFMFVIVGMVIAYAITAWREKQMRRWSKATGILAVAAALAVTANLPSLYNTYEYSKETIRGGHSELTKPGNDAIDGGLDRAYITQYSYGGAETFTLLIPNVKGGASIKPEQGRNILMSLDRLPDAQTMQLSDQDRYILSQLPQYFGEPELTNGPVYVGALIVALFLLGCVIVRGPMKWTMIVLTLLSIGLALGRNLMWLTDLMIDYMPMYSKFRTPESILVIAEFTMPLMAALALQKLLEGDPTATWKRYRKAILWTFGPVLAVCLLGVIAPGIFGNAITPDEMSMGLADFPSAYNAVEQLRLGMVADDCMRSFIIVGVALGLLALYFYRKLSMTVVVIGSGILVLGDLFMVNKRYLDHDSFTPARVVADPDDAFPLTASDRQILADTTSNYRVMEFGRFSDASPSYRHKTIGGYHAAKLTRYQDMIEYYFTSREHDMTAALNMLNARWLVGDPNAGAQFNPGAMGNAWFVDKVTYVDTPDSEIAAVETLDLPAEAVADKRFADILGSSWIKSEGDTIYQTSYAPDRLTYHATTAKGGVAVFSEVYFPWGWHATIDGQPAKIGRVNYVLRAMDIPAGSHTIEMRFEPRSLKSTSTAAYVAIIIIYLALIAAIVLAVADKRKQDNDDSTTDSKSPLEH